MMISPVIAASTSFQNSLRSNLKIKEEAVNRLENDIKKEIKTVKDELMNAAKRGDYKIDYAGRKVVSYTSPFLSKDFGLYTKHCPLRDFEIWQSKTAMNMSPSRRKYFYREHYREWASAYNANSTVTISVNPERQHELDSLKALLEEVLSKDGISVALVSMYSGTGEDVPATYSISNRACGASRQTKGTACLQFKYSCIIPDPTSEKPRRKVYALVQNENTVLEKPRRRVYALIQTQDNDHK